MFNTSKSGLSVSDEYTGSLLAKGIPMACYEIRLGILGSSSRIYFADDS